MYKILWCTVIALLIFACSTKSEIEESTKTPIVGVFSDILFLEDTQKILSGNEDLQDSAQLVNAYIDRWVREKVMLNEARRQLKDEETLAELVESYKNSLILHNYEEQVVAAMLDTLVGRDSIESYFLRHEKDFILNNDIYEVSAIISKQKLSPESLVANFEKEQDTASSQWYYCHDFIEASQLKLIFERTEDNLPLNKVMEKNLNHSDNLYLYIHRKVEQGNVAPLAFVEKQVRKLILHKRKIKLLEKTKDQHYREAMKKKEVRFY